MYASYFFSFFFFNDTATTEIYTLSLHDALPIYEGSSGEVDGVPKEKYWDVVDQCYLCDLCYVVKCPYVPPHPWNVDRKSTRLNSSHSQISYAVFCLKKKNKSRAYKINTTRLFAS